MEILYHLGKPNVVIDALNHIAYCHHLVTYASELSEEVRKLNLRVVRHSCYYNISVQPVLDD
jgi:hypothetical protein